MLIFIFIILLTSCQDTAVLQEAERPSSLTFLSWNIQNLFDGEKNGQEYSEFDPSTGNWTEELYQIRLAKFSSLINEWNSEQAFDFIALIEIENETVLENLADKLKVNYNYRVALVGVGYSVRTGFLSQHPISKVIEHQVGYIGDIPLRSILEVQLHFGGNENMAVFVNHWKSRSGGVAKTEFYRRKAAAIIRKRQQYLEGQMKNKEERWNIIVLGDLNENWDEESLNAKQEAALSLDASEQDIQISGNWDDVQADWFYTPWPASSFSGSYIFRDEWNTLDHFLLNYALNDGLGYDYQQFWVVEDDELFWHDGSLNKWKSYTQDGYSDHLPLALKLVWNEAE